MLFTIDGEPRGKQRPRHTKAGIVYTPTETTHYEKAVKAAYIQAGGKMIEGPVKVEVWAFMKIPTSLSNKKAEALNGVPADKRPDIDNILKIVYDGLQGVAFADDKQITETVAHKVYNPVARVVVDVQAV